MVIRRRPSLVFEVPSYAALKKNVRADEFQQQQQGVLQRIQTNSTSSPETRFRAADALTLIGVLPFFGLSAAAYPNIDPLQDDLMAHEAGPPAATARSHSRSCHRLPLFQPLGQGPECCRPSSAITRSTPVSCRSLSTALPLLRAITTGTSASRAMSTGSSPTKKGSVPAVTVVGPSEVPPYPRLTTPGRQPLARKPRANSITNGVFS